MKRLARAAAATAATALFPAWAQAQAFPAKPVHVIFGSVFKAAGLKPED